MGTTFDVPVDVALEHHGIKGMKWYRRRFQNEDGSLTPAGKARYLGTVDLRKDSARADRLERKAAAKSRKSDRSMLDKDVKQAKGKPNISYAESISKDTSNAVRNVSDTINALNRIHERNNPTKTDASSLSDEELRRRINRLNMERQYSDLVRSTSQTSKYQKWKDAMDIVVPVVGVASSVVGIAATVHSMRLKHEDEDDYLEHFGVKGMHWGVRRYQNYDGTYTQAGLKRYNQKVADYEQAVADRQKAKKDYKEGLITKTELKYTKGDVVRTRNAKKLAYQSLKRDYLADQGKEYYKQGQRVRDNWRLTRNMKNAAAMSVSAAFLMDRYGNQLGIGNNKKLRNGLVAAGLGTYAVATILKTRTDYVNRRLSAYYAH